MLCCVGLFGGLAVGQYLGGPWTLVAPAAGFGLGLVADMKLMRRMHKPADESNRPHAQPAAEGDRLAAIRRTYESEPAEPPRTG